MKMRYLILIALVLPLAGISVANDDKGADREAIGKISEKFGEAINAGNAVAVASLFTDDAVYATNNGMLLKGRGDIGAAFGRWLKTAQSVETSKSPISFRRAGDMAYVMESYSHTINPPEADSYVNKGYSLGVFEKQDDGSWRIESLIVNKQSDAHAP